MKKSAFTFGTSAKEQVAQRIKGHIGQHFESHQAAAENLGITKQRLFTYVSAKSFPGPEIVDLILKKWGLDLLGGTPRVKVKSVVVNNDTLPLFETPLTLRSEHVKVLIQRKGSGLVAQVEISANVKIA